MAVIWSMIRSTNEAPWHTLYSPPQISTLWENMQTYIWWARLLNWLYRKRCLKKCIRISLPTQHYWAFGEEDFPELVCRFVQLLVCPVSLMETSTYTFKRAPFCLICLKEIFFDKVCCVLKIQLKWKWKYVLIAFYLERRVELVFSDIWAVSNAPTVKCRSRFSPETYALNQVSRSITVTVCPKCMT